MEEQEHKPSLWFRFKRFSVECKRVLKITKKPDQTEFKTIVKVTGVGILIMGLLGFVIQMVTQFIKSGF